MTITLPDDLARQAGISEKDALVALACWLYDTGKLDLTQASRLAGLERPQFEAALMTRGIDVYRPTAEDVRADVEALKPKRKSA
jgi:predicted HTH domain antitoxin